MTAPGSVVARWLVAETDGPQLGATASLEQVRASVLQIQSRPTSGELVGLGSGFEASEDGLVITNHHGMKGVASFEVGVFDSSEAYVVVVPLDDAEHDVAVVRVNERLSFLPLGDAPKATVGEPVMRVDNPLGLDSTVSGGTVAACRPKGLPEERMELSGDEDDPAAREAVRPRTASAGQGNSSRPVLDANGRVLGLDQAGIRGRGTLTFAVPSNTLALETARAAPRSEAFYQSRRFNLSVSAAVLTLVMALQRRGAWRAR